MPKIENDQKKAKGKGRVYGLTGDASASEAQERLPMTINLTPEMRRMVEEARGSAGGISNVELLVRLLRFFIKYEAMWPIILEWPNRFRSPLAPLLDQINEIALPGPGQAGVGTQRSGGVTQESAEPEQPPRPRHRR